ncbi:MAG: phosphohistidine phosphatase SixA [Gammaproteobacteria bacterium]|nr:phosphohistidine phosphatase SixA [Gammaproteobacteria bacterium]MCW5583997.1 phosphohistidine phosphatase SixA [Gammaproteobacteria bacterium]
MKIYLARHGDYLLDTTRHLDVLTEKGTKDIIRLANFLRCSNEHVSHVFHSGKYRAQQTAELLIQGFICEQPIQSKSGLNPNDDITDFANELSHWGNDVLIVGHLPFMSKLVSALTIGNENKEIVDFQAGTLVCLETIDHVRWVIKWVLTPDLFVNKDE